MPQVSLRHVVNSIRLRTCPGLSGDTRDRGNETRTEQLAVLLSSDGHTEFDRSQSHFLTRRGAKPGWPVGETARLCMLPSLIPLKMTSRGRDL